MNSFEDERHEHFIVDRIDRVKLIDHCCFVQLSAEQVHPSLRVNNDGREV